VLGDNTRSREISSKRSEMIEDLVMKILSDPGIQDFKSGAEATLKGGYDSR
jgi:hypothetical protein